MDYDPHDEMHDRRQRHRAEVLDPAELGAALNLILDVLFIVAMPTLFLLGLLALFGVDVPALLASLQP